MFGVIFGIFVADFTLFQAQHCNDSSHKRPSHEQPVNSPNEGGDGDQKPSNNSPRQPISCGIAGFPAAIVGFMDENEGFFVGLFTALLFAATILLWRATNALWTAGERQIDVMSAAAGQQYRAMMDSNSAARQGAYAAEQNAKIAELALLAVEVPYLYPFIREHGILREIASDGTSKIRGFEYGNEFIKYYFKNFGRTPAEIIEVFSQIRFGMGMPQPLRIPDHPLNRLSGIVVASGGESENFPCDFTKFMYESVYRGSFDPKRDIVWFSGYVRYLDVFENEYILGFCMGFDPKDNKFYSMGTEGYNFRRKTRMGGQITAQ